MRNVRIERRLLRRRVVFNRGREAAGAVRASTSCVDGDVGGHGRRRRTGAADADHGDDAGAAARAARARPTLEAVADARAEVDEADEENNSFSTVC